MRCLRRFNFPLHLYLGLNKKVGIIIQIFHLSYSIYIIYTYHFNYTLDKMWVPSTSHAKILGRTGMLVNLEFLVVGKKKRGNNTVT